ncbi:hypothetical protein HGM15179_012166 [Zosterops borbonicus]|uniref:Uncharacterized protein n=1 Tax=Zosterops borbonicus TaxID=364589 RepID=A0A8K1GB93_9PASS|nr:hypothetical protein HGM15179_012166 [Zosterops borbonicus]
MGWTRPRAGHCHGPDSVRAGHGNCLDTATGRTLPDTATGQTRPRAGHGNGPDTATGWTRPQAGHGHGLDTATGWSLLWAGLCHGLDTTMGRTRLDTAGHPDGLNSSAGHRGPSPKLEESGSDGHEPAERHRSPPTASTPTRFLREKVFSSYGICLNPR